MPHVMLAHMLTRRLTLRPTSASRAQQTVATVLRSTDRSPCSSPFQPSLQKCCTGECRRNKYNTHTNTIESKLVAKVKLQLQRVCVRVLSFLVNLFSVLRWADRRSVAKTKIIQISHPRYLQKYANTIQNF